MDSAGLLFLLGIIYPVFSEHWNAEDLLPRSLDRVSFKECNLDPGKRQECGGYGVTEDDCYARECCWGRSEVRGVPWCYHSIKTNTNVCAASDEAREECGWMGIRKEQCLASDCCWRPSVKGHVWCVKKVHVPVFKGECGKTAIKPNTLGRIIGGEDAVPHSWPWMASLQEDGKHFCGGSLINHEWILSAAHCYIEANTIAVVLGAHNVTDEDNEKTKLVTGVSKAIQHDNWSYGIYDIMLLKLEHPVEFNDVISPLCLATEAPSDGQHCYSMGWGVDEWHDYVDETTTPDLLQQFMSPVVDTSRCNGTEMYDGEIGITEMCAGYEEGGRGNCFGDSGGPLVMKENGRWSQVGIVSWGIPCALAMYPTVYTDVAQMVEWMEKIVGEN